MIYTFYSYKGGVGRTMALANIAELFYQAGLKVLMVDWDLEAPGLERFFPSIDLEETLDKHGLIDMLLRYKERVAQEIDDDTPVEFESPKPYIINVYPDQPGPGELCLITAGRRSKAYFADYARAVLTFDWQEFYKSWGGELYFNWLREEFESIADVTLIDSRTGVTEMGGVCTYQLADAVAMFCAPNQQSIDGVYGIAQNLTDPKVQSFRRGRPLNILIIPARIERAEGDLLDKFQDEFIELFKDLVPRTKGIDIHSLWQLSIPYIPKYAYEEAVAVRESGRASAEDMVTAFRGLRQLMEHLRLSQLAYMQPSIAARELALAFSRVDYKKDSAELMRIASLVETFAEPLAEFAPLLVYARGMASWAHGDVESAAALFGRVIGQESQVRIAGVDLAVPEQIGISESITVDKLQILLVEDQRVWRRKLQKTLEGEGYKVETAVGYGEALGKLRQASFDLLVTDLRLGSEEPLRDYKERDLAGMALLDDAHKRHIPTIVVTEYATVELARRAYEDYDVLQFLSKATFEGKRFIEVVRRALIPAVPEVAGWAKGGLGIEYRDFDLWIEASTAEGYPLRASSETQGQSKGFMELDPMSESVQSYLDRLADWATDEAFLIEFGTFLYNLLFTGDIESLFQLSLGEVIGQEEQGLRIRLRIDPPEISMLPWEYLYSPRHKHFLGASQKTPLTRYLELLQPIRATQTILPLRVLVVIPSGSGLDTEKEKDILTEALDKLEDAVQLTFLEGNVTRTTVADALIEQRYHVFHFVGHGAFQGDRGYLLFNDESGGYDLISDDILVRFFLDQPSVKLVVLNACQGAAASSKALVGMAPKLVTRGIPAVITYQYLLMEKAASCFAREFYRYLSEVGYLDVAMAYARNQMSVLFPAERSFGAPVLFMQTPNGLVFYFRRLASTTPPL